MWKGDLVRKQLTSASGEFSSVGGEDIVIHIVKAINADTATVKLKAYSDFGDDLAYGANYDTDTATGITMLLGEQDEGRYSAITCFSGTVEVFYTTNKAARVS